MARRLGPRFGLEAAFLIGVAAVAAIVELEWTAIIAVMFVAWLVVAAVEVAASRRGMTAPAPAPAPEPVAHVHVLEPVPAVPEPPPVEEVETPEAVAPAIEPEPEPESEPEPEAEAEPEPEEPVEEEPVEEEPPPPPPPQLALMPAPPPKPEPEPVAEEPQAAARPGVVPLRPAAPREWNIWELERRARDRAGQDPARDEEWGYLFLYLREFATPEGTLPLDFDDLVRSSFGDLIGAGR